MTASIDTGSSAVGRDWGRIARWLVGGTMAYNLVEGVLAVAAGIAAGSIALVGFGLDSTIELAAAGALFWRLRVEARGAERPEVERTERRVRRFIGGTFLALALYVTGQSAWVLWRAAAGSAHHQPAAALATRPTSRVNER